MFPIRSLKSSLLWRVRPVGAVERNAQRGAAPIPHFRTKGEFEETMVSRIYRGLDYSMSILISALQRCLLRGHVGAGIECTRCKLAYIE